MVNVVVLISGNGSNLQSIINNADDIGINISLVISNTKDAYGLIRAHKANITAKTIISKGLAKNVFEDKLIKVIDHYQPQLIILAGFMVILTAKFINHYPGIIINIHPSLLPKFKGLNTNKRVLQAKEQEHGATVHVVSEKVDSGEIILQKKIKVLANDDENSLAKRLLKTEHILYPQAIKKFIQKII